MASGKLALFFISTSMVLPFQLNADLETEYRIEIEASGMMSMMASAGTVTTAISGNKSRSESDMKSKSKMFGKLMQGNNGASITRLDKELFWQLNPDKKQYTEMTFEQLRAQMEQVSQQMEQLQQSGSGGALPVSEEQCQWSDADLDVVKTGEKQRFANVKASQYIITVKETCTVPENGQTCEITWRMENWMAKRMPGADEIRAFTSAMAEKTGMSEFAGGGGGASMGLMSMFRDGWDEVNDETANLKGYPVKTVMQMEMGGEACTTVSGQPIAMDDVWGNAMDAGINAGAQSAGYHAGSAVSREAAQAMGGGVGGSIAGSAVGAASGEVISGMLKHFGKKKKKPPEPEEQSAVAANPASGSAVLFRISNELISVSDRKIDPGQFEAPASWEKVTVSAR